MLFARGKYWESPTKTYTAKRGAFSAILKVA
jgi:hypothetical protein